MNENYERYIAEKAFFDFAVAEGYMSEEERVLIAFYRSANSEIRQFFFDLVTSLPRI